MPRKPQLYDVIGLDLDTNQIVVVALEREPLHVAQKMVPIAAGLENQPVEAIYYQVAPAGVFGEGDKFKQ